MAHPLSALIPLDAERIQIQEPDGSVKFIKVSDLQDIDTVVLNKQGLPVVTKQKSGRPKNKNNQNKNQNTLTVQTVKNAHKALKAKNKDPLYTTLRQNPDGPDVLSHVMAELGEEVYILKEKRDQILNQNGDPSNISGRRIQALNVIVNTYLKRKDQIASSDFEIESPQAMAFAEYIISTLLDAMHSAGVDSNRVNAVMSMFAAKSKDPSWKVKLHEKVSAAANQKK